MFTSPTDLGQFEYYIDAQQIFHLKQIGNEHGAKMIKDTFDKGRYHQISPLLTYTSTVNAVINFLCL